MRKLGIHIPHWRRLDLFHLCLRQLRSLDLGSDWELEIAVSGPNFEEDRRLVEQYRGRYVGIANSPLGAKCNAAVELLRDCDAIMGLGSDDLICSRGARALLEALDDADMAGFLDLYLYDLERHELWHWPGYEGLRKRETVGPGRVVKRWLMDELEWAPFGDDLDFNLDRSMFEKLSGIQFTKATLKCLDADCMLVDVKTQTNINPMAHIRRYVRTCEQMPHPWRRMSRHFGADMVESLHEVQP
jgi:hypothetical protein